METGPQGNQNTCDWSAFHHFVLLLANEAPQKNVQKSAKQQKWPIGQEHSFLVCYQCLEVLPLALGFRTLYSYSTV